MKFSKFLKMVKMCFHLFSKQISLSPPSPSLWPSPNATTSHLRPLITTGDPCASSAHFLVGSSDQTITACVLWWHSAYQLQWPPPAIRTADHIGPPSIVGRHLRQLTKHVFYRYIYMFVFKFFMYTKQKNKRSSFPVFCRQKLGNQHCYQTTPYWVNYTSPKQWYFWTTGV